MKRIAPQAGSTIGPGAQDLELTDGQPNRLKDASGQHIEVLAGIAWITVTGVAADIVLRAGQVWEIPNDGLVLMEAVGYGRVRLHGPAAPAGSGWPRKEQPAKVQMPSGRPCLP